MDLVKKLNYPTTKKYYFFQEGKKHYIILMNSANEYE